MEHRAKLISNRIKNQAKALQEVLAKKQNIEEGELRYMLSNMVKHITTKSEKKFVLKFECESELTVEQLWPNGDYPTNPTENDVINLINHEGGAVKVLSDWNLWDYDGHVTIEVVEPEHLPVDDVPKDPDIPFFNPDINYSTEKTGNLECPDCDGNGCTTMGIGSDGCQTCNGFGVIKRETE